MEREIKRERDRDQRLIRGFVLTIMYTELKQTMDGLHLYSVLQALQVISPKRQLKEKSFCPKQSC